MIIIPGDDAYVSLEIDVISPMPFSKAEAAAKNSGRG
jgi:hypothetical protein